MLKFSFVILHYQTFTDTVECVDSILRNIDYKQFAIVIVNNGSTNDSGHKLEERYRNEDRVNYIDSQKNLGFAQGNNLGFAFAKYELKADFICLLNNDTVIKQHDFIKTIVEKYKATAFHILGPDIVSTVDGEHQNPETETLTDLATTRAKQKHYKNLYLLNLLHIEMPVVKLKRKLLGRTKSIAEQRLSYKQEQTNVKLHGSCLIFSKRYIEKYEGLCPKTFMYGEESILNFIAKRDNLRTVYCPLVQIFHNEDSSTNYQFPKDSKKRRFYYKNLIASMDILIELMRDAE